LKKASFSNLSSETLRKNRTKKAIKESRKKNFKDKKFPSSDKARKLKEWRDGWFSGSVKE
jgi:hypothetical protein